MAIRPQPINRWDWLLSFDPALAAFLERNDPETVRQARAMGVPESASMAQAIHGSILTGIAQPLGYRPAPTAAMGPPTLGEQAQAATYPGGELRPDVSRHPGYQIPSEPPGPQESRYDVEWEETRSSTPGLERGPGTVYPPSTQPGTEWELLEQHAPDVAAYLHEYLPSPHSEKRLRSRSLAGISEANKDYLIISLKNLARHLGYRFPLGGAPPTSEQVYEQLLQEYQIAGTPGEKLQAQAAAMAPPTLAEKTLGRRPGAVYPPTAPSVPGPGAPLSERAIWEQQQSAAQQQANVAREREIVLARAMSWGVTRPELERIIVSAKLADAAPQEMANYLGEYFRGFYGGEPPQGSGMTRAQWRATPGAKQARLRGEVYFKKGKPQPEQWAEKAPGLVSRQGMAGMFPATAITGTWPGIPGPEPGTMMMYHEPTDPKGALTAAKRVQLSGQYEGLTMRKGGRSIMKQAPVKVGPESRRYEQGFVVPMAILLEEWLPEGQMIVPADLYDEVTRRRTKEVFLPEEFDVKAAMAKTGASRMWKAGEPVRPFEGASPLDLGLGRGWSRAQMLDWAVSPEEKRRPGAGGGIEKGQMLHMTFAVSADPGTARLSSKGLTSKYMMGRGDVSKIHGIEGYGISELKDPTMSPAAWWFAQPLETWAQALGTTPEAVRSKNWQQWGEQLTKIFRERVIPEIYQERPLHFAAVSEAALERFPEGRYTATSVPGKPGFYNVVTDPVPMLVGEWFQFPRKEDPVRQPRLPYRELQELQRVAPEVYEDVMTYARPIQEHYEGIIMATVGSTGRRPVAWEEPEGAPIRPDIADVQKVIATAEQRVLSLPGVRGPDNIPQNILARYIMDEAVKMWGTTPLQLGAKRTSGVLAAPRHARYFTAEGVFEGEETTSYGRAYAEALKHLLGGPPERVRGAFEYAITKQGELAGGPKFYKSSLAAHLPRSMGDIAFAEPLLKPHEFSVPTEVVLRAYGVEKKDRAEFIKKWKAEGITPAAMIWGHPAPGAEPFERLITAVHPDVIRERAKALRTTEMSRGAKFRLSELLAEALGRDFDADILWELFTGKLTRTDQGLSIELPMDLATTGDIEAMAERRLIAGRPSIRPGAEAKRPPGLAQAAWEKLGGMEKFQAMADPRNLLKYGTEATVGAMTWMARMKGRTGIYFNLLEDIQQVAKETGREPAQFLFEQVHGRTQTPAVLPEVLQTLMSTISQFTLAKTGSYGYYEKFKQGPGAALEWMEGTGAPELTGLQTLIMPLLLGAKLEPIQGLTGERLKAATAKAEQQWQHMVATLAFPEAPGTGAAELVAKWRKASPEARQGMAEEWIALAGLPNDWAMQTSIGTVAAAWMLHRVRKKGGRVTGMDPETEEYLADWWDRFSERRELLSEFVQRREIPERLNAGLDPDVLAALVRKTEQMGQIVIGEKEYRVFQAIHRTGVDPEEVEGYIAYRAGEMERHDPGAEEWMGPDMPPLTPSRPEAVPPEPMGAQAPPRTRARPRPAPAREAPVVGAGSRVYDISFTRMEEAIGWLQEFAPGIIAEGTQYIGGGEAPPKEVMADWKKMANMYWRASAGVQELGGYGARGQRGAATFGPLTQLRPAIEAMEKQRGVYTLEQERARLGERWAGGAEPKSALDELTDRFKKLGVETGKLTETWEKAQQRQEQLIQEAYAPGVPGRRQAQLLGQATEIQRAMRGIGALPAEGGRLGGGTIQAMLGGAVGGLGGAGRGPGLFGRGEAMGVGGPGEEFVQRLLGWRGISRLQALWGMTGGAAMGQIPGAARQEMAAMQAAAVGMPLGQYPTGGMGTQLMAYQAQQQRFRGQIGRAAYGAYGGLMGGATGEGLATTLGVGGGAVGVGAGLGWLGTMVGLPAAPLAILGTLITGLYGWQQSENAQRGDILGQSIRMAEAVEAGEAIDGDMTRMYRPPKGGRVQQVQRFPGGILGLGQAAMAGNLADVPMQYRPGAIQYGAEEWAPEWMGPEEAPARIGQWMRYGLPGGMDIRQIFQDPRFAALAQRQIEPQQLAQIGAQWGMGPQGATPILEQMLEVPAAQAEQAEYVGLQWQQSLMQLGATPEQIRQLAYPTTGLRRQREGEGGLFQTQMPLLQGIDLTRQQRIGQIGEAARLAGIEGVPGWEETVTWTPEQRQAWYETQAPRIGAQAGFQQQLVGRGAGWGQAGAMAGALGGPGQIQGFQRLMQGDPWAIAQMAAQPDLKETFRSAIVEGFQDPAVLQAFEAIEPTIDVETGLRLGMTGMPGAWRAGGDVDVMARWRGGLPGGVYQGARAGGIAPIAEQYGMRGLQAMERGWQEEYQDFQFGQRGEALQWQRVSQFGGEFQGFQTRGSFAIQKELRNMNRLWSEWMQEWRERNQELQLAQFLENWQVRAERLPVQFQWQREDLAFRGAQQTLQYAWGQEDVQEQMRYATGRQRRQLMRQQGRQTIQYAMGMGRLETEEQRLGVREQWAREDLDRQRRQFLERWQLQDEYNQHWRSNWEQRRGLEDELQRIREFGARFNLQQAEEQLNKQVELAEQLRAVQDYYIAINQQLQNAAGSAAVFGNTLIWALAAGTTAAQNLMAAFTGGGQQSVPDYGAYMSYQPPSSVPVIGGDVAGAIERLLRGSGAPGPAR